MTHAQPDLTQAGPGQLIIKMKKEETQTLIPTSELPLKHTALIIMCLYQRETAEMHAFYSDKGA